MIRTSDTQKLKILGVAHDVYICSAAVVVDGEVISAIAEERLDRRKQSRLLFSLAIDRCLREAGLTMRDIDEVAVAWNPAIEIQSTPSGYLDARRWRTEHLTQVPARLTAILGTEPNGEMTLTNLAQGALPVTFVDHYHAHLGNALPVCPEDPVAFLVMDGRGETLTGQSGVFAGGEVNVLSEVHYPHSLGLFYGMVTQFLVFKPDSDEWKVMALASYADPMGDVYDRLEQADRCGGDGGSGSPSSTSSTTTTSTVACSPTASSASLGPRGTLETSPRNGTRRWPPRRNASSRRP